MIPPENPYEAPAATVAPAESRYELHTAGTGKRFVNFLIDQIAARIVIFGIGIAIGVVVALVNGESSAIDNNELLFVGVGLLAYVGYYVVLEGLFGRTLGKMVSGTLVVNSDGRRPRLPQIIGRSFARLIPFDALSFLGGGRGWHDSLSGTWVVERTKLITSTPVTPMQALRPRFAPAPRPNPLHPAAPVAPPTPPVPTPPPPVPPPRQPTDPETSPTDVVQGHSPPSMKIAREGSAIS